MTFKIKYLGTILALLFISCGQGSKMEKEPKTESQGAVEIIEAAANSLSKAEIADFVQTISNAKSKDLPHIEASNFDSFIEEEDYKKIDFKALNLNKIYPDFDTENQNYKAISNYTVPINTSFNSVVITILKSEHEMETVLINYDMEGTIIAHQVVAYDEIAEGMSQTVSRISEDKLTVNRIFWGNTKTVEQIEYEIRGDGTIEKVGTKSLNDSFENFDLIDGVLTDLQLDWVQTKTALITTKTYPENPNETIVVIPEIVDEGIQYFDLNSHIVIVNNRSRNITHKFFESHNTNQWVSDAIELDGIQIDPTLYQISEDKMAFGLKVSHFGHSRVNPYSNKTLSLFTKSGDGLLKILSDYTLENYGGEWDGDCNGEFVSAQKIVIKLGEKTNGHFNLLVNTKITETKDQKDKNEECQTSKTVGVNNAILKFNGKTYIETNLDVHLFAEFHPQKSQNIIIKDFEVDQAYQLGEFKFVSGNYKPINGQHAALDTENDWGDRLLMLNASNELIYKSQGVGDVYLFEPHFYKSDASNKTIIICQKAYEYPFGGEVFILENGKINYIGTLDMEGDEEGKFLTEVIEITEIGNTLVFSLKSDEVILKPGSEDIKTNKNVIYVYQDNELALKNNP